MLESAIARFRTNSSRIERLDELGDPVCMVMLPETETPPDRTCFGARNLAGKELPHFGDVGRLEYTIKTLVWQIRPIGQGGLPLSAKEAQNMPTATPRAKPQNEPDAAAVEKLRECEERWAREGSLLQFLD